MYIIILVSVNMFDLDTLGLTSNSQQPAVNITLDS